MAPRSHVALLCTVSTALMMMSLLATGSAANTPTANSAQLDAHGNPSAETPAAAITVPPAPSAQELAGDSLYQFIVHHATTHYFATSTARNLARWRGGKQSICPQTVGLTPEYNDFVTARIRALAAYVGAPVQSDADCDSNVKISFTNNPQEAMDSVTKWATGPYFRNRYSGGERELIAYKSDHAIQGWYMTTNAGAYALNDDVTLEGVGVLPVWPKITQSYSATSSGSRLGGGSGDRSGIGIVILVVDQPRVVGHAIGTIADYLAMLTLTLVQSPDHCDPLPSILDLMSATCGARDRPTAITSADLAFLKAVYYKNTGLGPSHSRAEIEGTMMREFRLR